jgi:hypothetical protein
MFIWGRHRHYVHPSQEDPARWRIARAKCWHDWGDRCLYRSPALGIKCNRTWGDPIPWRFRTFKNFNKKTRMNADHIYPAYLYPDRRWDQDNNLQPLCEEHNDQKGIRGHIDYRPGHYHRATAVTLWWVLLPLHLLMYFLKLSLRQERHH